MNSRRQLHREGAYLVYVAVLSDGSIYVGRTGLTLEKRIEYHRRQARRARNALHRALMNGTDIAWEVVWKGTNYFHSMGKEIAIIRNYREAGITLVNRTRGGYYDSYDCKRRTIFR